MKATELKFLNYIFYLSVFTILYNLAEGLISVWFGLEDETLSLAGFGFDSMIEMFSGTGILIMSYNALYHQTKIKKKYELTALKITGVGFFILVLILITGSFLGIIYHHKPLSTFWGWIISSFSIVIMVWLYHSKIKIGKKLNNQAIIADAKCTLICIYMSVILLLSSSVYELTGFAYIDSIGAIGLAWFSATEGIEAFEKYKNLKKSDENFVF